MALWTADKVADSFLELLSRDENLRKALLVCAAARSLTDEVAHRAISLVAGTNGSTDEIIYRLKDLNCVRVRGDGTWRIAEDVQPYLVKRLNEEFDADLLNRLSLLLGPMALPFTDPTDSRLEAARKRHRRAVRRRLKRPRLTVA